MQSPVSSGGSWIAKLGQLLAERKRAPWERKPVPLVLLVLSVALAAAFAGCTSDVKSGAALADAGLEDGAAAPDEPVAVIEVAVEAPPAMPGEALVFDGSASHGRIALWSWSFGDDTTSIETDPRIEHAYEAPGEYNVVLLVRDRDGREDYDVTRITVATPPGTEPAAETESSSAPTEADRPASLTYVWEAPKYADAFESLSVSTVPIQGSPYAGGLAGSWVHADFVPDDGAMLLDALVVYQDFTGQSVCEDRNAKVSTWIYDAGGHYYGQAVDCGARLGLATQVYVGLCVEYDGVVIPPEEWVQQGDVVHGDKMDDCWSRILKVPA